VPPLTSRDHFRRKLQRDATRKMRSIVLRRNSTMIAMRTP
jgi:hypothetical protein